MNNLKVKKGITVCLPAPVGSKVYWVASPEDQYQILEGNIISYVIDDTGVEIYCRYEGGLTYWHYLDDRNLFINEKEAKKYLNLIKL